MVFIPVTPAAICIGEISFDNNACLQVLLQTRHSFYFYVTLHVRRCFVTCKYHMYNDRQRFADEILAIFEISIAHDQAKKKKS